MITLCTLFNTNYIDKGLTMFESIERYTKDFVLYVLCMDDRCYEILKQLDRPRFVPIKLESFENEELKRIKKERSMGEYCWTCSSSFLSYIMENKEADYCAYIDSDLYFYQDVNIVVDEMKKRNASVMIVGHRFHSFDKDYMEKKVGKYCVEFNTFKNDDNGRSLLKIWTKQCLDYCKCDGDGIHWGDQKYMDNWCDNYNFVVETENLGAGIAPWNLAQYRLLTENENGPIEVSCRNKCYTMFFYHFQGVRYIDSHKIYTNIENTWGIKENLINSIYKPYLEHLDKIKTLLEHKFGVVVLIKEHPGYKKPKSTLRHKFYYLLHTFFTVNGLKDFWNKTVPFYLYRKLDTLEF